MALKGLSLGSPIIGNEANYAAAFATDIAGFRSVPTVADLYNIKAYILSHSGNNTNNDAIGQVWRVTNNTADTTKNGEWRLKDWSNHGAAAGWEQVKDNNTTAGSLTALEGRVSTAEGNIKTLQTTTGTHTSQIGTINNTLGTINTTQLAAINASDAPIVTNVVWTSPTEKSNKLTYTFDHYSTDGDKNTQSYDLPVATTTTVGLMSATDKSNLNNAFIGISGKGAGGGATGQLIFKCADNSTAILYLQSGISYDTADNVLYLDTSYLDTMYPDINAFNTVKSTAEAAKGVTDTLNTNGYLKASGAAYNASSRTLSFPNSKGTNTNVVLPLATSSADGLMSKDDKFNFDSIKTSVTNCNYFSIWCFKKMNKAYTSYTGQFNGYDIGNFVYNEYDKKLLFEESTDTYYDYTNDFYSDQYGYVFLLGDDNKLYKPVFSNDAQTCTLTEISPANPVSSFNAMTTATVAASTTDVTLTPNLKNTTTGATANGTAISLGAATTVKAGVMTTAQVTQLNKATQDITNISSNVSSITKLSDQEIISQVTAGWA